MTETSTPPSAGRGPGWNAFILTAQAVGAAVLVGAAIWGWLALDTDKFFEWMNEAGAIPFFVALALLPAIGFPTTPFYLIAGATFGSVLGLLGSAASLAVNLLLCYWLTHSGLRPLLESWLARTRYNIPTVKPGNEVRFTVVTKLLPGVPAFIKNYIVCLSGVPFGLYFGLSFAITLAYAAAFILLGESIYERDVGRGVWGVVLLVVVIVGVRIYRKRAGARDPELTG